MLKECFTRLYESMNLYSKMITILLLISVLPIFVMQYTSYKISNSAMEKQTRALIMANLEQATNSVETFFQSYDNVLRDLCTDRYYLNSLKTIKSGSVRESGAGTKELVDKLKRITVVNSGILGVALAGTDGTVLFYDSVTMSGEISFCFDLDRLLSSALMEESIRRNTTVYSSTVHKSDNEYGKKTYFYIAHSLIDTDAEFDKPQGSIILCVNERALQDAYITKTDLTTNMTFVVGRNGDILSFPIQSYAGMALYGTAENYDIFEATRDFFVQKKFMSTRQLEVNTTNIKGGVFKVVNVQNLEYALKNAQMVSIEMMLIALLMAFLCVLIAMAFARSTNKSVKIITQAMHEADQGDYNVQISLGGKDEFAVIAQHFNDMIIKIRESTEQEKTALIKQKNAEIKSLEAQINPHFLYNTLDAINWVALSHDEFEISRMLVNLAAIMRYSIKYSNEIVTVQQEIDYIQKYIYLQQERFNYSFSYEINVEPELLSCKIHKLLIQPLVENAIVHAFPGKSGQDKIEIRIKQMDERYIRIQVRDNGKGMSADQVALFNAYIYRQDEVKQGIGVSNVISRLKLYYGSKSNFYVESEEGKTVISFVISYEG